MQKCVKQTIHEKTIHERFAYLVRSPNEQIFPRYAHLEACIGLIYRTKQLDQNNGDTGCRSEECKNKPMRKVT